MDANEFRKHGNEMIDYVAKYWETLRNRVPFPDVQPGYLKKLIPKNAPEKPEKWPEIFKDLEFVVSGNTHWHHPNFYAYFPTACAYPAIIADILSGGLSSIGFSWKSSPSMTELELSMMDWLAAAFGLPEAFHNRKNNNAIGIIQSTASDATFVAILAARARITEEIKSKKGFNMKDLSSTTADGIEIGEVKNFGYHDPQIMTQLIAYCSDQAHSSVDKGVMLAAVRLRKLKTTRGGPFDNFYVSPKVLLAAIKEDRKNGFIPFIFIATIGTTSSCGVDPVDQLAPICHEEGLWIHVDSAYAGSFMICPEYRYLTRGFEYIDSFNTNAHKALLINFDCSPMWFRKGREIVKYFEVNPLYLSDEHKTAFDYRHLQIALGRRFRSLKIWFVMRIYGIEGLQAYLRQMISLAKHFEELIKKDDILELFVPRSWGLVCFRIKNSTNEMNEELNKMINDDKRLHMVPSNIHGIYFIRFVICSTGTTQDDVANAHKIIHEFAENVLKKFKNC